MSVKIRLQRKGRKKRPFYHIVVADARSPRDGRFIEKLGTYNPMTSPATIDIDRDKAYDWLMKGAQPTDTARAILRFKGVYYKKHLMRGVEKGAMTVEEAEAKYQEWVDAKDAKIAERFSKWEQERKDFQSMVSGTPPPPEKEEEAPVAEATEAEPAEAEAPAAEPEAPAEPEQVAEAEPEKTAEEAPAEEQSAEAPATQEEETVKKEGDDA